LSRAGVSGKSRASPACRPPRSSASGARLRPRRTPSPQPDLRRGRFQTLAQAPCGPDSAPLRLGGVRGRAR
jgi:hypothetical protein